MTIERLTKCRFYENGRAAIGFKGNKAVVICSVDECPYEKRDEENTE